MVETYESQVSSDEPTVMFCCVSNVNHAMNLVEGRILKLSCSHLFDVVHWKDNITQVEWTLKL